MINYDLLYLIGLLHVDILFLPAFSKSLDIKSSAELISREFNCITVMVNCCSAYHGIKEKAFKKVGYITSPAWRNGERRFHTFFTEKNEECGNCDLCKMMIASISIKKIKKIEENKIDDIYVLDIVV